MAEENPVSVRKCGECDFYDSTLSCNFDEGGCLLYNSVSTIKRRLGYSTVLAKDLCRFGLRDENETAFRTKSSIADIANKFSDGFKEKISPRDIRTDLLQLSW